jgi:uncharacterized protein (DUF1800 family)
MSGALDPFVPSPHDPWDPEKAGHLLRRAGFGPLPQEVAAAVEAGPDRAVDALFAFPPDPAPPAVFEEVRAAERRFDDALAADRRAGGGKIDLKAHPELRSLFREALRAHVRGIQGLTAWWLDRMTGAGAPLQEKLTLFWHGHFTSSFGDVHDAIAMYDQNALFRRNAAGNFARLLDGVARDPAMLRYLNNDENRKGHPNENWARELMELFTLGIGHYTETDVKQSARAWTGWTLKNYRTGDDRRTFAFRPRIHDYGEKTFLGQTGPWDGTDIMRIILSQPAAPQFIAGKLAAFFVAPRPDAALVEAMARRLRETNWEMRPVLRAMFRSRAFYRPDVMHAQIKSPVEFVVGAVRHLGVTDPNWVRLSSAMAAMGQHLFYPPTVAGWRGGTSWINAGTVFTRADVASALITGRLGTPDMAPLSSIDTIAARLLGASLRAARRATLARITAGRAAAETVHLVMSMPEYQVA